MTSRFRPTVPVVFLVVAVLVAAVGGAWGYAYLTKAGEADQQRAAKESAASAGLSLSEQVQKACKAGGPEADALGRLCTQAKRTEAVVKDAVDDPRFVPVPGRDGRDGPTLNQVIASLKPDVDNLIEILVRREVTEQFAACIASGQCVGDPGADGPAGSAGRDAYPFTFEFTAGRRTYTCTVTSPDSKAACATEGSTPPPTPEPTPTATVPAP